MQLRRARGTGGDLRPDTEVVRVALVGRAGHGLHRVRRGAREGAGARPRGGDLLGLRLCFLLWWIFTSMSH